MSTPAKDILHDTVKDALIADGWSITHDPFVLPFGRRNLYADLGTERVMVAERDSKKIVVEVKSFIGPSRIADLQKTLGQYLMYHVILSERYPEYELYVAMDHEAFNDLFQDSDGQKLLKQSEMKIFTIDIESGTIKQWIN